MTFDQTRADTVYVDGVPSTIDQANPIVSLSGGQLTQITPGSWQVTWNTGEEATITEWSASSFNITDGIPFAEPDMVGGLQGEDAGAYNDFQLSNGTVLQQPLTSAELYGEFADSWRVTPASSLFDYLPGQSTATFTNTNFPADLLSLADLPSNQVAAAAKLVAAAGITDPGIAAAAELDYVATGDPGFIAAAQQIATEVTSTTPVTVQASTPPVPAVGVDANPVGYTEASGAPTPVTFDAYLTVPGTTDIVVDYAVVANGAGFADAATFGGTLPSGSVTIAAGTTLAPFIIDLPTGALGTQPTEQLAVRITAPGGTPVFAPQAVATIANNTKEAGATPVPQLLELTHEGTFTENSPTSYTLALGTLTQGQVSGQVQLALANDASPPGDELSGTFSPPTGAGFLIKGDDLPGAIAAGAQYDGLYVAPLTSGTGRNSETLTFNAKDVNDSGFLAALSPITLTITDTVLAAGIGQLNTPQTIVFPNVHVGTPENQDLSVSNTGAAPIAVSVTASEPITVHGTIPALAAGATDDTDLSVGVDTSSAGPLNGAVDVSIGTTDPTVDVFGDVYRLASGTVTPVTEYVHVGDPGTVALSVGNTAAADGFSENLLGTLASVTGGLGIAAAGPTGEIAAGTSDAASLRLDFATTQAGTVSGTATVDLTSDGGTGAGSIDGLGTTALTPQTVPVAITVDNYANPVFEDVSNPGAITGSGTAYTLNLGTVTQGATPLTVNVGVLNNTAGPSDVVSGSLAALGSSAFINSGLASFGSLAAGQADVAPTITLATGTAGTFSETLTLSPTGSNAGGYSAALPNETLTVTGTVAPSTGTITVPPLAPAVATVLTANPLAFGPVHVGATAAQVLAIENSTTAPAAALDASVASVSGAATASGSFSGLAAGATDASSITVGLNTGTAGPANGGATLALISDAGTLGSTGLPGQTIGVSGTVYREAAAALLPLTEIVHVGDPGTASLAVANSDPADGYSENLIALLIGTTGSLSIAAGGPTGEIAAGATNSALALGFSTAQAGTVTGTATVGLTSDGGTGAGSIDGLGTTALSAQTVPVAITVDNYADPVVSSDGSLTASGADAYVLNLGTAVQGAAALSADLTVANGATGPADWLDGTFAAGGTAQFSNAGLAGFSDLAGGGSLDVGGVSLATGQVGVFSETITLSPTDANGGGFSQALAQRSITVTGTIVAPTGTAQGDVHMVTFDGLHYDFQAVGGFVLTRSTVQGDTFQIQIETAASPTISAVSITTAAAAQVGSDVVTFGIDRGSVVWVDGAPDTALSAGNPVQNLAGGQLVEISPTTFRLTWATGEALTITDSGAYLNSAVSLPATDGAGSVQGLLGSDSGQANDFQLPDGTVLARPLSDSELYGAFATAWRGAALFGAAPMQFIYSAGADGQTVMQATAPGQILSGGDGVTVLSDADGFGATFLGSLSDLANEAITGFSAKDVIDVTDLNSATAAINYDGSSGAGVLTVSDGVHGGGIQLSGQISGGFHVTSDGHGGSLIALG